MDLRKVLVVGSLPGSMTLPALGFQYQVLFPSYLAGLKSNYRVVGY